MGVSAIPYGEMVAYADLHGFRWEPFELDVIDALDAEFQIHQAERAIKQSGEG